ncbi:MAG TPA: hypothetical protein VMW08_00995 [Acidimicrobiales bacterium]|nr:hypothetical protein [Acidimicrobiales bacterium]
MSVIDRTRPCRGEGCGRLVPVGQEGPWCNRCAAEVYAFCPRPSYAPDEWFFVAYEGDLEATKQDGDHAIAGDQCDGCGLSTYGVYTHPAGGWYVRCDGEEIDSQWFPGCGAEYRVARKASALVTF